MPSASTTLSPWLRMLAGLALATLMLLFTFQVASTLLSSGMMLGIVVEKEPGVVRIESVLPHSPASRAGLPAGSQLLRIDDHPIGRISDISTSLRERSGERVTLEVRKDGTIRDYQVQPGMDPPWHQLILNFLVLWVYIGLGMIALKTWRVDRRLVLFGIFCLVVSIDVATDGNYNWFSSQVNLLLAMEQMLAALQFSLIAHLLSLIPNPAPWMRHRVAALGVIYGLNLAGYLGFTLVRFDFLPAPQAVKDLVELAVQTNAPYILWGIMALIILLGQYRHNQDARHRGQLHVIMAGVLPWVIFQLGTTLFAQTPGFFRYWHPMLDVLTHLLFALAILFAIFRYNLLDLNEFISYRAISRVLPSAILVFATVLFVTALLSLEPDGPGQGTIWVASLAALAAGLLHQPLQDAIMGFLESGRSAAAGNLARNLRTLSIRLNAASNAGEMEQLLNSDLARALECRFVHLDLPPGEDAPPRYHRFLEKAGPLFMNSGPAELRSRPGMEKVELFLPLHHEGRYLGTLLVGRNLRGHLYTAREVELLGLFADNVATRLASLHLRRQAERDELTGLLRRENILEAIEGAIGEHLATGRPFWLGMLDLDNFKSINDRFGHLVGDQALRETGALLQQLIRPPARAGRFGGEEFIVLLPGGSKPQHLSLLEEIRQAVGQIRLDVSEGRAGTLSVSIGLAGIEEATTTDGDPRSIMRRLIDLADRRLYSAKEQGKNRCVA